MAKRWSSSTENESPLEQWLRRYLDALQEVDDVSDRVERINATASRVTSLVTGMPKGGHAEDIMPLLMDERKELGRRAKRADKVRAELLEVFELLPVDERRVLCMFYLDGIGPIDIAERMGISSRQVDYLKQFAMERLTKLPDCIKAGKPVELVAINKELIKKGKTTESHKRKAGVAANTSLGEAANAALELAQKSVAAAKAKQRTVTKEVTREVVPKGAVVLDAAAWEKAEKKAKALGLSVEQYVSTLIRLVQ